MKIEDKPIHRHSGMEEETISEAEKQASLDLGYEPWQVFPVFFRHVFAANTLEALRSVDNSQGLSAKRKAYFYTVLQEKDRALAEWDRAYDEREFWQWIKVDPNFDPLRDDPRLQDLLPRMNLGP